MFKKSDNLILQIIVELTISNVHCKLQSSNVLTLVAIQCYENCCNLENLVYFKLRQNIKHATQTYVC